MDRFLVWLGAGIVAAGVAMIAAAGPALADSPDSPKPTENAADSNVGGAGTRSTKSSDQKPKTKPAGESVNAGPGEDAKTPGETRQRADEPRATHRDAKPAGSDTAGQLADQPVKPTAREHKPVVKPAARQDVEELAPQEPAQTTVEPAVAAVMPMSQDAMTAAVPRIAAVPTTAAVAFAAPSSAAITSIAAPPSPFSGLLSAIGTIVFNLYGLAIGAVGGPPVLPAGSTVTVRSSTLRIDCGNGYEVPADWYIPNSVEPPTRLIYLQHGFLAAGPWYSYTAAALAEQTNSIVVAPSITSNFLSCDACWLGAPPMQKAVANLFDDDNTALADSALAAGYTGPIPDRIVLVGHSLGGGLVAGTAGYMVDNGTVDRLAGVIMLDGVGLDDTMTSSLEKVPDDIPIYQLAAPRYFWNQFGVGTDALLDARPDRFIGVTLVGGSHVDSMRGGNFLIQFSQQLVAGFSRPENVAAAQALMVGWVDDMFAGNHDEGIYLHPGEEFFFDTPAGEATMVALPNSLTKPFLLNPLQALVPLGDGLFTFQPTCVTQSVGAARCTGALAA